jgi:hypothetical protein
MNVAALIVVVGLVTQFAKKLLGKINLKIEGTAAVVLSVVVSIGVVLVEAVKLDVPIGIALVPVLIQVIVGSNMGYSLLKVASGK